MNIDPNFKKSRGMSRFFIDDYRRSLICPIAKVASSSWLTLLRKLIDQELKNRTLRFSHNKRHWPPETRPEEW